MLSLSQSLEQRRVTVDEVLAWSSAIAAELCALHQRGQVHGEVTAANILVLGAQANLAPRPGDTSATAADDIAQFAALLREMLEHADAGSPAARAEWRALQRVAETNANAGPGSRIKKVSLALQVLKSARRVERPAPVKAVPESRPRGPRVLMLVRAVPVAAEARRRRIVVNMRHVWAFLVSAASVAIAGSMLFLRLSGR